MTQPTEYKLQFRGGPAAGENVFMVVPPPEVRWYLEYEPRPGEKVDWWVWEWEPEPDPRISVTKYVKESVEEGADGKKIVIYAEVEQ